MGGDIILPWPPKELSPNSTAKLRLKMRAKKAYRETCWALSLGKRSALPSEGDIRLRIVFNPPDHRHRDDDNMLASFKHGRDGVAQALQINDRRFPTSFEVGDVVPGGQVVVSLG